MTSIILPHVLFAMLAPSLLQPPLAGIGWGAIRRTNWEMEPKGPENSVEVAKRVDRQRLEVCLQKKYRYVLRN